jgi:phosphate transport system substrate-binding protein
MRLMRLMRWVVSGMMAAAASLAAQEPATVAAPSMRPAPPISGPIILHSWGSAEMAPLMEVWETAFTQREPNLRFSDTLKGTETAQAALFTHVADMALMSRPILPLERHVIFRREHHLPLEIQVATGSTDALDRSFALAVLVQKDNPLRSLTLAQLDGIFGDQRSGAWDEQFLWHPEFARGADKNIRTWGQLGLTGAWKNKPVHVYGYPVTIYSPTSGPMLFFRKTVMQGGDMWNPDLQEYPDAASIAAALSRDPFGIAYTCLCASTPSLKPLALAADASPVALTMANVADRSYPLSRPVYIYIDRTPGEPVAAGVNQFLDYVLSPEGQQAIARSTGYLPLTAEQAAIERRKLQ